jgi:hypothetical protein
MAEPAFSRCDVMAAIDDGKRGRAFFGGRQRNLTDADIIRPAGRTSGGQARYDLHALVRAVVANMLLDWGLRHPDKLPQSERANPCRSVFWAMAEALDPMTIDLIVAATRQGEDWLLRIDRIQGADGEPSFLARAYPITDDRNYGETPEGCTSTLSLGLRPLIAHLVGRA